MPILDTLQNLFGGETETTIEVASMEFITAGDNYESKTILPLQKYELGVSFLQQLSKDINLETEEITTLYNQERINYLKQSDKNFKVTKLNFTPQKLSDTIDPILKKAMILAPSNNGLSREQLKEVLKWLREEKAKVPKQDSINAIQNYLNR